MDCIIKLLFAREQIQILHWQTEMFGRHKAYDEFFASFSDLLDNFVEVYQGRFGRITFDNFESNLMNINDLEINEFMAQIENCINELRENSKGRTDLINLSDEMLAEVGKLKYLLTLK